MSYARVSLTTAFAVHVSIEWPAGLVPETLVVEQPALWLVVLLLLWLLLCRDRE